MMQTTFARFAQRASEAFGSVWTFLLTLTVIGAWLLGGLVVGFSEYYQMVINTVSTLTTSLYVVLIQHTQNRQEAAMQTKLDELIRVLDKADNRLIGVEKVPPAGPQA